MPFMRGLTPLALPTEGMVPYGTEGLQLPPRYAVEVDDPKCPVLVEVHVVVVDGQPRCAELRCRPKSGGPLVMSEDLRHVALARYVRQSAGMYAYRVEVDEDGQVVFAQSTGTGDEPLLARAVQKRPRQQMTDERLREVAQVYSEAGSKPTMAVMRHFYLSRPTAGRWVGLARDRGFLPPVSEPKARKR
jgi:hypothetical protein